jgi:hypothetical protein
MELQVNEIQIPERISFNYEELKQELVATLQRYEGLVYTPDQMKVAKADKAALNKLKKALNDERIRRERDYMLPFLEFKKRINELIALIDKPIDLIDSQVKEYEEQKKCEKRQAIEELFDSIRFDTTFDWLQLDQIFKPQWLNATTSMKSIEEEIQQIIDSIIRDLSALSEMPAFAFEATEVYKQTLNLQTAVNEGKRLAEIQRRKEEAERMKAEAEAIRAAQQEQAAAVEDVQPEGQAAGQWISFKAFLTVAQAVELRKFFERNGIDFKAI